MEKRYQTVLTIQKFDRKIVVRDKLDYPNTYIHSGSFSWLGIGTGTIKSGEVELVLWVKTPFLLKIMRSCKHFQHVSKISTLILNRANSLVIKNTL